MVRARVRVRAMVSDDSCVLCVQLTHHYHHLFWLGDLNYRINLSVRSCNNNIDHVLNYRYFLELAMLHALPGVAPEGDGRLSDEIEFGGGDADVPREPIDRDTLRVCV